MELVSRQNGCYKFNKEVIMEIFLGIIFIAIILILANPLLTKIENNIANFGKDKKDKR